LAQRFREIRLAKIKGRKLRDLIQQAAVDRFDAVNRSTQTSTQLY